MFRGVIVRAPSGFDETGARKGIVTSHGDHDVGPPPPSRNAGSHRQPPPRYRRCTQELLPCLQVIGPMYPDPHLPVEMLNLIIDHLHDTTHALRNCCLISKSWVPRARNHLFADIKFPTTNILRSWKDMFPDPSISPAHYAKTLSVGNLRIATVTDVEAGGWIKGFSRIIHLRLGRLDFGDWSVISLIPFHGLSPVIKSLHITVPHPPSSCIFDLILSFPLLEDLVVAVDRMLVENGNGPGEVEMPPAAQPLSPPTFTGSLDLYLEGGMKPFAHCLLSLSGGIHFQKLALTWLHEEDPLMTTRLVEECSHALESLNITWRLGKPIRHLHPYR